MKTITTNGLNLPIENNLATGTGFSFLVHGAILGLFYLTFFHNGNLALGNTNLKFGSLGSVSIVRPKPIDEWIVADRHQKHHRVVKKAPEKKPDYIDASQAARQPAWVGNLLDPDEYPAAARQQGSSGKVVVKALIDASGVVKDVQLLAGDSEVLNEFVVSKIRNGIFTPAYNQDNLPVACEVILPIVFQLNG